ncbi:MAG: carboxypeptidase regulatory-like domain-containing protein [Saprospiraceae bacterium]|nr:carboxypeptidase regulatory-like domain-containing protein [Saprospiraceae bacterium]
MTSRAALLVAFLLCGLGAFAQVTTSTIAGTISDSKGEALIGATVVATHVPSGTRYGTATNAIGRYTLPAVRVGGPFSVTVTYTGYEPQTRENVYTNLGTASNVNFSMQESGVLMDEVVISANRNDIFSSDRTGAAQTFGKGQLNSLPTIGSRSIGSITKYNPNGNGSSFGGQDSRLNNFTIDGSVFNNGFGLGTDAQAGGRTGSTAISLDAIEELQVNVAPFDVRQSGFVGSGINAVTRSGTNDFSGSAYYNFRNNSSTFNGTKAAGADVAIGKFDESVIGARFGGPIIKDKLFFFVNGEMVRRTEPAITYVPEGSTLPGTVTRVKKEDLEELRRFLKTKYGYETGEFEGYDNETTSDKFLARLDYNLNDKHKLTLRYTFHNSEADQLISNSSSLGNGTRRTNTNSMSYQNSGYIILDNTRSIVAEWNGTFTDKLHNNFIVGYDKQNENRKYKGALFPTIDILDGNSTYISAGFDPFTPANKLNYGTFHITDNLTFYQNKHTITVGANYENYKSNNNFFPGSNGVYIFNSLADFYAAANSDADTSPVSIKRFQYRYSALPGAVEPLQVLKVNKIDLYGQDEFQVSDRFKLVLGLRASAISFAKTAIENPVITAQDYVDETGNAGYKINTGTLPETKILWEPRLGFNWDVTGKKSTQIRGGTGIFTGRPPYVWVSNQIGNNGVLTGFIDASNTTKYKFTPDATEFTPATPTLPTTFDIAATDPNYQFPQIWKSNLAIDQKLPLGLIASAELIINKNINAVKYFDSNFKPTTQKFTGPDTRPRFPGASASRVNSNVSRAAVMTNTNDGGYTGVTLKLEYPTKKGFYGMAAYTYSQAKDLMSAGSIASGSWTGARSVRGNNDLDLAFADQDMPSRVVGILGYRLEYGDNFGGATQFSLGFVSERRGFNPSSGINTSRYTFTISGDMNGDGVTNNDLLYVPNSASELTFVNLTAGGVTYTPAEQAAAFDAFINQDEYLSTRRGQYAERNGALFPVLNRFDLSVIQEFGIKVGTKRNTLQFRVDILNFSNLLNNEWGVGTVLVTDRPLATAGTTAEGVPTYRLATQSIDGSQKLLRDSFIKGVSQFDVWNAQIGLRYIFN